MGILTDSTSMEEPKDPDSDTVFALYSILASEANSAEMRAKYLQGNYGYGHAKQELYDCLLSTFGEAREKYQYYINNVSEIDELLNLGAQKAQVVANDVLQRVRAKLGY
jgi:tryptophanyl-tRNA synthetase